MKAYVVLCKETVVDGTMDVACYLAGDAFSDKKDATASAYRLAKARGKKLISDGDGEEDEVGLSFGEDTVCVNCREDTYEYTVCPVTVRQRKKRSGRSR